MTGGSALSAVTPRSACLISRVGSPAPPLLFCSETRSSSGWGTQLLGASKDPTAHCQSGHVRRGVPWRSSKVEQHRVLASATRRCPAPFPTERLPGYEAAGEGQAQ